MSLFILGLAALLAITLFLLLWPLAQAGESKMAGWLAVGITLAGILCYGVWGAPRVVPLVIEHDAKTMQLRQTIQTNSDLIQQEPKNLEAWLTLSQAFMDRGDYAAAAHGFKEAVLLSKGNPRIVMAYAEALIMQEDGKVTAQAKKSIDISLMLDPQLPLAHYYHAVWLLQENRQDEAMREMKKLYQDLPDDSSLKQRIRQEIGR